MGTAKLSNQSSDKLFQILECLSKERLPIRLQDLSLKLGMPQATVLRYLKSLQDANYVYQEEDTSRYALTWKICALGENLNSNLGLRTITSPFIAALVNELNLGVCLVVEQNMECMYLDCIDASPASFQHTFQRIGKLAPMHATGSGKLLLSQYSPSKLKEYLSIKGLPRFTDYTITDEKKFLDVLAEVKETQIGMDNQECELGLRCISSPLYDYTNKISAALSVFGDASKLDQSMIEVQIIPLLKKATETISLRLGYERKIQNL